MVKGTGTGQGSESRQGGRVSQPIVAPGAESQLKEHLLQSICATAGLSLVMIAMIVRFQKEMRLVSLEIPEPNATNPKLTRSRATKSTLRRMR
jgi:hypothetical protein